MILIMKTIFLFIYLVLGGILGGLASTMAGMASLATYPVLLSLGIPPIYANITNDAALIWAGIGSTASSINELKGHWQKLLFFACFSIFGSIIGCFLLIRFPSKTFEKIVPFCIAFSGIMVLLPKPKDFKNNSSKNKLVFKFITLLCIIITGLYTGYFGAAAGVLMLGILNLITDDKFLTVNAMKNVINALNNFVALIIYIFTAKVYWSAAIPLAIGVLFGSYLGPKAMRFIPIKVMKWTIAALTLCQALYFGYTAYLR